MFRRTVVVMIALLVSGCAPFSLVGGPMVVSDLGFEVVLPEGWYRANQARDALLITRDGFPLQLIRIERIALDKELQFTKRKFSRGMPPHDVAEMELDNVRSDQSVRNFELFENAPATIGASQGFRLVYQWRTPDGLRLKRAHYGFMTDRVVYRIVYQGAARHYFDRDLPAFNSVVTSFKILKGAA